MAIQNFNHPKNPKTTSKKLGKHGQTTKTGNTTNPNQQQFRPNQPMTGGLNQSKQWTKK